MALPTAVSMVQAASTLPLPHLATSARVPLETGGSHFQEASETEDIAGYLAHNENGCEKMESLGMWLSDEQGTNGRRDSQSSATVGLPSTKLLAMQSHATLLPHWVEENGSTWPRLKAATPFEIESLTTIQGLPSLVRERSSGAGDMITPMETGVPFHALTWSLLGTAIPQKFMENISFVDSASHAAIDAEVARLIALHQLDEPFYLTDIGALIRLFLGWQQALPRVTPFYAVKCSPSPVLLGVLGSLGAGFDCASKAEIAQVLDTGVDASRIIYANPCKMPSHLKHAAECKVPFTTFDSEEELDKIKSIYPEVKLLLRIQTKDSGARCPLGTKYGALLSEVDNLLHAAARRDLQVVGVSFHIGSAASDASAFYGAIACARAIFDRAAEGGRPMNLLDIGGGFTAPRPTELHVTTAAAMTFEKAAEAINLALDEFFPQGCGVNIIAEPGRYFAETPTTLATRVFGKRVRSQRKEYWINDGLYGSMNCVLYDHAELSARPLHLNFSQKRRKVDSSLFPSTVFGPTCDGLDVVLKDCPLPEMEMGDWLIFQDMGAYTTAAGSNFNGFSTADIKTYLVYSLSGADHGDAFCLPEISNFSAGSKHVEVAPVH